MELVDYSKWCFLCLFVDLLFSSINFSRLFQALDAKVLIFKKKRRKNYRRTKGHRQVHEKVDTVILMSFS